MKSILITGAGGGMGRATATALARAGYRVFALDKAVSGFEENIIPIEVDVTDEQSVKNAFRAVCQTTEELFAVIHFAGIYRLDSLVEMSEEDFVKIFNVNLFGVYRINKVFLSLLNKGSKIIITTSELAPLSPLPFTGVYAITKKALDEYAYSLRMEVQLLGISVAVLRPGAVDTGMIAVSTSELERFINKTELYECNSVRFKNIVNAIEARKVKPNKIAKKVVNIVMAKRVKQVYNINRNPLLLALNILPRKIQTYIIKRILK